MDDHRFFFHLAGRRMHNYCLFLHLPWRSIHNHRFCSGWRGMHNYSFRPGRRCMHHYRFRSGVDVTGWRVDHYWPGRWRRVNHHHWFRRPNNDHLRRMNNGRMHNDLSWRR
jgi:hypothetical protein